MSLRNVCSPFVLAGIMALAPRAARADEPEFVPPPGSNIVNNSDDTWQLRISDKNLAIGVVKIYKNANAENPTKSIQSINDTFTILPHKTVKIVIVGSPMEPNTAAAKIAFKLAFEKVPEKLINRLKNRAVLLHLSLEKMTGNDQGQKAKLHFVHGILAKNPCADTVAMIKEFGKDIPNPLADLVSKKLKPVIVDENDDDYVTVDTKQYQQADDAPDSALWEIHNPR